MIYTHSPKAIVIAGAPAAGKTTAATVIRDRFGYALLHLDGVNAHIVEQFHIEFKDLRNPSAEVRDAFKLRFVELLRAQRFDNIVIEGCRFSHAPIFAAFRSALFTVYGDHVMLHCFYLHPPVELRAKQYVLRQAMLAKKAAKDRDPEALRKLAQEHDKGFVEFLEPVLPGFEVVDSADRILDFAQAWEGVVHPDLNPAHAPLIKAVAESGSHNPFYQRIELNGEVVIKGFTDSVKSWINMAELHASFAGKTVCDIGCMHGYYSFKVEEAGAAHVVGMDIDSSAIAVAQLVAKARGSHCTFMSYDVTTPFDRSFDMILALNMLHRVSDFAGVSRNLFGACRECIVEIGEVQIKDLLTIAKEFGFRMRKVVKSHRCSNVVGQRVLMLLAR